jgi:hypothetical protein
MNFFSWKDQGNPTGVLADCGIVFPKYRTTTGEMKIEVVLPCVINTQRTNTAGHFQFHVFFSQT